MRPVGGAAADHASSVHVRCRVAGIHAPYMRAERYRIAMRIHFLVVEIVVALRVGAQHRIVFLGCQCEWCAAAPAPHELRCDQLLFFMCVAVLAQEIAKPDHMLLETAIGHIAAVTGKNFWLRQIGRRSVFVRVPEDEFARLERRTRTGRRRIAECLR